MRSPPSPQLLGIARRGFGLVDALHLFVSAAPRSAMATLVYHACRSSPPSPPVARRSSGSPGALIFLPSCRTTATRAIRSCRIPAAPSARSTARSSTRPVCGRRGAGCLAPRPTPRWAKRAPIAGRRRLRRPRSLLRPPLPRPPPRPPPPPGASRLSTTGPHQARLRTTPWRMTRSTTVRTHTHSTSSPGKGRTSSPDRSIDRRHRPRS